MKLSIVIPVYNGAATIAALVDTVHECITEVSYEIVLVDDGSRDDSAKVCEKLALNKPEVKFIGLRKNFGEHNAVMCGLNFAEGDFVAIIDDDFQNPPAEILKLLKVAESGVDVVYSRYSEKKHHWFRNFGSYLNDRMANYLLQKPKDLYLSSFKLIRKEVVQEIIKYKGPFPYIDGLILRITRNIAVVTVEHKTRREGRSNYTFSKLVSLWLNMFLNFSIVPVRLFTFVGAITFLLGLVLSACFVVEWFISPNIPSGWTSVIVAVVILSGLQAMFLGLLGEFIGKQYLDQNGTPQWVIRKTVIK